MAVIAAQSVPVIGAEIVWSNAAAGGDEVPVGNGRILLVRNGHTAAQTATLATPGTARGLAIEDPSKAITANGGIWSVPLVDEYRNGVGRATLTYSAVTALQVAVLEPAR
ncbi:MAG TPA: hypothetical protein VM677_08435 [Actinokineospora sp.]|jgi:hypothetical protein|nr:hypothetical protein [Actinokineospora sp.]